MAYIICEPCVGTCDTACVEVCPVDCIHGPTDKEGAGAEAKVDGLFQKILTHCISILKNVLIVVLVSLSVLSKLSLRKVKFPMNGINT